MLDFISEHYIVVLVLLLLLCALVYVFNIRPNITKSKTISDKVEKTDFGTNLVVKEQEKVVTKEVDLVEIKEFDDDEYVREVFNSVFYSIQFDNWDKEISYDKIKFGKKKQSDRYNVKSVTVEFEYRFDSDKDYKKRIFTVKDITLRDGSYTSFRFKNELPIDIKKFLYDSYSDWINERNSKEKEKVDKSLENIKDVLGKASERGAKLDELLGN